MDLISISRKPRTLEGISYLNTCCQFTICTSLSLLGKRLLELVAGFCYTTCYFPLIKDYVWKCCDCKWSAGIQRSTKLQIQKFVVEPFKDWVYYSAWDHRFVDWCFAGHPLSPPSGDTASPVSSYIFHWATDWLISYLHQRLLIVFCWEQACSLWYT